jgi:hypothetical protein
MYPHERSLVKRLAGKPFALVGVNTDRSKEELKTVLQQEQITWRSFFDGQGGSITQKYKIHAFPSLFVIDHKGAFRYKFEGNPGDKVLDDIIDKLVKEAMAKR